MLEKYVSSIFASYLGRYVKDLDMHSVKVSVWNGQVQLNQMQLKRSALSYHGIPVYVHYGSITSGTINVPWSSLSSKSCEVVINEVNMILVPKRAVPWDEAEENKIAAEVKRDALECFESTRAAVADCEAAIAESSGFFTKLQQTILHNLVIRIKKIHIRYEDTASNPKRPFVFTVTVEDISFRTVDEKGIDTFLSDVTQLVCHKALQLSALSVRVNPGLGNSLLSTGRCDMFSPEEWYIKMQILASHGQLAQDYVIHPIDIASIAKFSKLPDGSQLVESRMQLPAFSFTLQQSQYAAVVQMVHSLVFSHENDMLRRFMPSPSQRLASPVKSRWDYAISCVMYQVRNRREHRKFDWEDYLIWKAKKHLYKTLLRRKACADFYGDFPLEGDITLTEVEKSFPVEHLIQCRTEVYDNLEPTSKLRAYVKSKSTSGWWKEANKKKSDEIMMGLLEGKIDVKTAAKGWKAMDIDIRGVLPRPKVAPPLSPTLGLTFNHSFTLQIHELVILLTDSSAGVPSPPSLRNVSSICGSVDDAFHDCIDSDPITKVTAMVVLTDSTLNYVGTPTGFMGQLSMASFEMRNNKGSVLSTKQSSNNLTCFSLERRTGMNGLPSSNIFRVHISSLQAVLIVTFFQELLQYFTKNIYVDTLHEEENSEPKNVIVIEDDPSVLRRCLRFYSVVSSHFSLDVHVSELVCMIPCQGDVSAQITLTEVFVSRPALDTIALSERLDKDEVLDEDFYSALHIEWKDVALSSQDKVIFQGSAFGLLLSNLRVPYTPLYTSSKVSIKSNKGCFLHASPSEVLLIREAIGEVLHVLRVLRVLSASHSKPASEAACVAVPDRRKVVWTELTIDISSLIIIPLASDGRSKLNVLTSEGVRFALTVSTHDTDFAVQLSKVSTNTEALRCEMPLVYRYYSTLTDVFHTIELSACTVIVDPKLVTTLEYLYDALIIALYPVPSKSDDLSPQPSLFTLELTGEDITLVMLQPAWQKIHVPKGEKTLRLTTMARSDTMTTTIEATKLHLWQNEVDVSHPTLEPHEGSKFVFVFISLRNLPPCSTVRFSHQIRLELLKYAVRYEQTKLMQFIYSFGENDFQRIASLSWRPYFGMKAPPLPSVNPMDVYFIDVKCLDCVYSAVPTTLVIFIRELLITNVIDVFSNKVETSYSFLGFNIPERCAKVDAFLTQTYSYNPDVGTLLALRIPSLHLLTIPTSENLIELLSIVMLNVAAPYPGTVASPNPPRFEFTLAISDGRIVLCGQEIAMSIFNMAMIYGRHSEWLFTCAADTLRVAPLAILGHAALRWSIKPKANSFSISVNRADIALVGYGVDFLYETILHDRVLAMFAPKTTLESTSPKALSDTPLAPTYSVQVDRLRVFTQWPPIAQTLMITGIDVQTGVSVAFVAATLVKFFCEGKEEREVGKIERLQVQYGLARGCSTRHVQARASVHVALGADLVHCIHTITYAAEEMMSKFGSTVTRDNASAGDPATDMDLTAETALTVSIPTTGRELKAALCIFTEEGVFMGTILAMPLALLCSVSFSMRHVEVYTCPLNLWLEESDVAEINNTLYKAKMGARKIPASHMALPSSSSSSSEAAKTLSQTTDIPWSCRLVFPQTRLHVEHSHEICLDLDIGNTLVVNAAEKVEVSSRGLASLCMSQKQQTLCMLNIAGTKYTVGHQEEKMYLDWDSIDLFLCPTKLDAIADILYMTWNPLAAELRLPTEVMEVSSDMVLHGHLVLGTQRIMWVRNINSNLISIRCNHHKIVFSATQPFPSILVDAGMNLRIAECHFETKNFDMEECIYLGDSSYVEYQNCMIPSPTKRMEEEASGKQPKYYVFEAVVPSINVSLLGENDAAHHVLATSLKLRTGPSKEASEVHGSLDLAEIKLHNVVSNADIHFQWLSRTSSTIRRKRLFFQVGEGWNATIRWGLVELVVTEAKKILASQAWDPARRFLLLRAPAAATALAGMHTRLIDSNEFPTQREVLGNISNVAVKIVVEQNAYRVITERVVIQRTSNAAGTDLTICGTLNVQYYDAFVKLGWQELLNPTTVDVKYLGEMKQFHTATLRLDVSDLDVSVSTHALIALAATSRRISHQQSQLNSAPVLTPGPPAEPIHHVEGQFPFIFCNNTGHTVVVQSSSGSRPECVPSGERRLLVWSEERKTLSVWLEGSDKVTQINLARERHQSLWLGDFVVIGEITSEDTVNVLTLRSQLRIKNLTGIAIRFPGTDVTESSTVRGLVVQSQECLAVPMDVTMLDRPVVIHPMGYSATATLNVQWKNVASALSIKFNHVCVPGGSRGGIVLGHKVPTSNFHCIIDITANTASDTMMVIYPTFKIENLTEETMRLKIYEHRPIGADATLPTSDEQRVVVAEVPDLDDFDFVDISPTSKGRSPSRTDSPKSSWVVVDTPKLGILDSMHAKLQNAKGKATAAGAGHAILLESHALAPNTAMHITSYDYRFALMLDLSFQNRHGIEVASRGPVMIFQGYREKAAQSLDVRDTNHQHMTIELASDFHSTSLYTKLHIVNQTELSVFVAFGGGTTPSCGQHAELGIPPFTRSGFLSDRTDGKVRLKIGSDGHWSDAKEFVLGTDDYFESQVASTDLYRTVSVSFEFPETGKVSAVMRIVSRWVLLNRTSSPLCFLQDSFSTTSGHHHEILAKLEKQGDSMKKGLKSAGAAVEGFFKSIKEKVETGPAISPRSKAQQPRRERASSVRNVHLMLAPGSSHSFCMGRHTGNTFSLRASDSPSAHWTTPMNMDVPGSRNLNVWTIPTGSDMDSPEASFFAVHVRAHRVGHVMQMTIDSLPPPYCFENRTDFVVFLRQRGSLRPLQIPTRQTRAFYLDSEDEEPVFVVRVGNLSQTYEIYVLASTGQPKVLEKSMKSNSDTNMDGLPLTYLVSHKPARTYITLFHAPTAIFRDVISRWQNKLHLEVSVGNVRASLPIAALQISVSSVNINILKESMMETVTFMSGAISTTAGGHNILGTNCFQMSYRRHLATAPLIFIMDGTLFFPTLHIVLRESVLHEMLSEVDLLTPKLTDQHMDAAPPTPLTTTPAVQETYIRVTSFHIPQILANLTIVRAKDKKMLKSAVGVLHVLVRNVHDVGFAWAPHTVGPQQSSLSFVLQGLLERYKKETIEQFHKILVAAVVK